METKQLRISYSELKRIHGEVISFTKEKADWYKKPTRKTKIEDDLGLCGLDNEDFLIEFSEKFKVDFSKMEYDKFLTPESELVSGFWIILLPILLPYLVIKWFLILIVKPFSKEISEKFKNYHLPFIKAKIRKDVTLGDLMISVIKKEFSEEKKHKVELKTA